MRAKTMEPPALPGRRRSERVTPGTVWRAKVGEETVGFMVLDREMMPVAFFPLTEPALWRVLSGECAYRTARKFRLAAVLCDEGYDLRDCDRGQPDSRPLPNELIGLQLHPEDADAGEFMDERFDYAFLWRGPKNDRLCLSFLRDLQKRPFSDNEKAAQQTSPSPSQLGGKESEKAGSLPAA